MRRASPPGRRAPTWTANAIAGAVLVALIAGVLLWQRPWHDDSATPPDAARDASGTLGAQVLALQLASSESAWSRAAGHSAWATQTWRNLRELGVTDLSMRYLRGGEAAARADGTRLVDVQVSWAPGRRSGLATAVTQSSDVVLEARPAKGGRFAIVGAERGSGVLPLWLAGRLDVLDDADTTVITVDGGNVEQPISQMTRTAARQVKRIVPTARGRLVVISPHTQAETAALLGDTSADIEQIAGVTTTLDGSSRAAVARAIVLNPREFSTMDRRAAQVVVTHEATHLLTHATTSDAASWIVEGFADWVALHDDTAPLSVSAGQILREVKADGAPKRLPTAADFGTSQHALGATYEAAWMAFRMLGQHDGDAKVLAFYADALRGKTPEQSARDAFGESVGQITRDWQAYLMKRASTVS